MACCARALKFVRDKGKVVHGLIHFICKSRLEQQVMLQEEQNEATRQRQALQEQRLEEEEEEDEEGGDDTKGAGGMNRYVYLLQGNMDACNLSVMRLASPALMS